MAGITVTSRIALIARSDLNALIARNDLNALIAWSGTAGRKLILLALKCCVSDSDTAVLWKDRYCVGDGRERKVARASNESGGGRYMRSGWALLLSCQLGSPRKRSPL